MLPTSLRPLRTLLAKPHAAVLASGIRLSDGKTKPAEIVSLPGGKDKVIGVVIHEGKNRQIHRMFEALGYHVKKLDRVAYAGITYEGLKRGAWRRLRARRPRSGAEMRDGRHQLLYGGVEFARSAREVGDGGEEVQQVGERLGPASGRHAWPVDDERAAHAVLIHALLAEQSVAAERESVVGRVDHVGVCRRG